MNENELNDVTDATSMAHYITTLLKIGEEKKAYNLIKKNSNDILKLFQHRLDHRWKLCYQFAQVVFNDYLKEGQNSDQQLNFINDLLNTAIADIEVQRSKISHMQERAAFSESTKKVYKFFLDILMAESKEVSEQRMAELHEQIINIVFLLSPRAVVEKNFQIKRCLSKLEKKLENTFNYMMKC